MQFPLQNIKTSCKDLTNVRIWNRFSVPHSGYKGEHFVLNFFFVKKIMFLTKNQKNSGIFKKSVLHFKDTAVWL